MPIRIPINCPYCSSSSTTRLGSNTYLGYRTFRCSKCGRKFNGRTGTPFNHLQFPTDIVLLVVIWRPRYKQGSSMRASGRTSIFVAYQPTAQAERGQFWLVAVG